MDHERRPRQHHAGNRPRPLRSHFQQPRWPARPPRRTCQRGEDSHRAQSQRPRLGHESTKGDVQRITVNMRIDVAQSREHAYKRQRAQWCDPPREVVCQVSVAAKVRAMSSEGPIERERHINNQGNRVHEISECEPESPECLLSTRQDGRVAARYRAIRPQRRQGPGEAFDVTAARHDSPDSQHRRPHGRDSRREMSRCAPRQRDQTKNWPATNVPNASKGANATIVGECPSTMTNPAAT